MKKYTKFITNCFGVVLLMIARPLEDISILINNYTDISSILFAYIRLYLDFSGGSLKLTVYLCNTVGSSYKPTLYCSYLMITDYCASMESIRV